MLATSSVVAKRLMSVVELIQEQGPDRVRGGRYLQFICKMVVDRLGAICGGHFIASYISISMFLLLVIKRRSLQFPLTGWQAGSLTSRYVG